jgi:hypothetical protein
MSAKPWLDTAAGRSIDELIALERDYRIDSIVVAIEGALLAKPKLTPAETVVVAVEAMEREVNNGGFAQFFSNSSSEYAPVLVSALQQIGAPETAAVAQRAITAWEASQDQFDECDTAYYELKEPIADKLFDFIKSKRAEIRP